MRTASILIRTKNEEKGLGPTLEGVFAQSVDPHEVLVLDSGSTDRTLEVAARYPVKILHLDPAEWGYSHALNVLAEHASGEILVCLSAHCVPLDGEWLAKLLRHFDDPSVAAAWGPGRPPGKPFPPPGPPVRQEPGSYTLATRGFGLSNGNSALRRALWQQFPFDVDVPAAEDKAWGREAMRRGYSVVFDPTAAVWHAPHTARNQYRRNRAVNAGFKVMFPELEQSRADVLRRTLQRAAGVAALHGRQRDLRKLVLDVRRIPTIVTGFVADLVHSQDGL